MAVHDLGDGPPLPNDDARQQNDEETRTTANGMHIHIDTAYQQSEATESLTSDDEDNSAAVSDARHGVICYREQKGTCENGDTKSMILADSIGTAFLVFRNFSAF